MVVTDPDIGRALGQKIFERPQFVTLDDLLPPKHQLSIDTLLFSTRKYAPQQL